MKYYIGKLLKKEDVLETYLEKPHCISPRMESFGIAFLYAIYGILWILLSDKIAYLFITDPVVHRQVQSYKGFFYVFLTTVLIYLLVVNRMELIKKSINRNIESYQELSATHEELMAMEEELRYQKSFTESIIEDAPVIIGTWDREGKIKSINPFGLRILGYKEEEMLNQNWINILIKEESKKEMNTILGQVNKVGKLRNFEGQFIAKDGKIVDILWNSSALSSSTDRLNDIVSIGTDITEKKKSEERLKQLAFYDPLTNLPNRTLLEKNINEILNENKRQSFTLVFMDVDNFKYINDTLGHHAGDAFLEYIGKCLGEEVKSPNVVARLGGDEFAIIFIEEVTNKIIMEKIEDLKHRITNTWSIDNHNFFISLSIGIACYPEDGVNFNELYKSADIAMYTAKKEGKGRSLYFKEYMDNSNLEQIEMARELQNAIEKEEFILYYQPQFELETGDLIGMEALIRWLHPEKGFVSPAEFIPLAEETGQIYAIERWVVKSALLQKQRLEELGFNDMEISINLSSKTLISDINFQEIEELLSSIDVNFEGITIEITETAIIKDIDFVIKRLNALKKRGVKIALDDFGTGYSSLTYLKSLPIDIVKLDRGFVKSIEENSKDKLIIKSLLYLARDLNYKVVAEGIETEEQLEYLKKYNCQCGQGYLLSRPLAMDKMNEMVNLFNKRL